MRLHGERGDTLRSASMAMRTTLGSNTKKIVDRTIQESSDDSHIKSVRGSTMVVQREVAMARVSASQSDHESNDVSQNQVCNFLVRFARFLRRFLALRRDRVQIK